MNSWQSLSSIPSIIGCDWFGIGSKGLSINGHGFLQILAVFFGGRKSLRDLLLQFLTGILAVSAKQPRDRGLIVIGTIGQPISPATAG